MSGEHIWSAWMGRLYPQRRFNVRERDHLQNVLREYRKAALDLKAPVVCQPCNNGWMSDLEDEAKPSMSDMILRGRPLSLLPRGIASISAFAFKTAVIADHMLPSRFVRFFSPTARNDFSRTLRVPDGVQIWIASFNDPYGVSGVFKSAYSKLPLKTFDSFEVYTLTFGIGHLIIQVVSWRWLSRPARRQLAIPVLAQNQRWDAVATEILSHQGIPVAWPPPQHLAHNTIHAFCYRNDFSVAKI